MYRYGKKEELLKNLQMSIDLLEKTKRGAESIETDKDGFIMFTHGSGFTLSKIKRNCTTARDLILEARKCCEYELIKDEANK